LKYAISSDNKGSLACNKLLKLIFSGQMFRITDSKLVSKAGLWKSKDTWNLMPLEREIFNSNDTKGEMNIFLSQIVEVECQISAI